MRPTNKNTRTHLLASDDCVRGSDQWDKRTAKDNTRPTNGAVALAWACGGGVWQGGEGREEGEVERKRGQQANDSRRQSEAGSRSLVALEVAWAKGAPWAGVGISSPPAIATEKQGASHVANVRTKTRLPSLFWRDSESEQ